MSSLTVTIIQTDLFWEDKTANLEMFSRKIDGIDVKTELVILPEMFSTGFSMKPELFAENMNGATVEWMKKTAMEKRIILTGSLIISDAGHYYNRLIWMLPSGESYFYDKRHLFAYGKEDQHYTAGEKRLIVSVKGWKINLQVCYDLRFPVWARQQVKEEPEYDLLVYVANWPERRNVAWKTLLQARAIENQCYVAGINRVGNDGNDISHTGDSMIVDPLGTILYQKTSEEDVFTLTLQKEHLSDVRSNFPFWKDGDSFQIMHN